MKKLLPIFFIFLFNFSLLAQQVINQGTAAMVSGGGVNSIATLADLPAAPEDGDFVWVASINKSILYEAADAKWYYADGSGRVLEDYNLEITGSPLVAPAIDTVSVVAGGSMTTGTHVCAVAYYNSTGGTTLPGASTAVQTITGGNQTLRLTYAAGGAGVRGKRIYCSKAGTASPLFAAAVQDDNTSTTIDVTVADASFSAAAPDVDFSRPLPTGWVGHLPSVIGGSGCGATATSIVCATSTQSNPSSSSSDPRAVYSFGADASDSWTAIWKVKRMTVSFPGGSLAEAPNASLIAAAFVDPSVAATTAVGMAFSNSVPLRSGLSLVPIRANRNSGTSNTWTSESAYVISYKPIESPTDTWFVMVSRRKDSSGDAYFFGTSNDGKVWALSSVDAATACARAGKGCASVAMTSVGISLERVANGFQGYLLEITDFSWKAY